MKRQLLSSLMALAALLLVPTSALAIDNYSTFTAKTVEGIDMTFYVSKVSDGVCRVYGEYDSNIGYIPAIDKNTTGTVTIPSEVEGLKVTKIENYAFHDCTGITTVNIPNTVTRLGVDAFYGCTSLTTITGIASLEYIHSGAFNNNPWYDNLPDGLLYIGKVLYKYKGTMPDNTAVTVKEGTLSISGDAFHDCMGLTSISIPTSVTSLHNDVYFDGSMFRSCDNLTTITVTAGNPVYDSRNNCNAIVETSSNTIVAGCKTTTFPSTITAIGNSAFKSCTGLTSIVIPNNIQRLEWECFSFCSSLESVVIGNGLKAIESFVFFYCDNLKSIEVVASNPYYDSRNGCNAIIETASNKLVVGCLATAIPNTVTAIGQRAFYGIHNMTRIDIPNSVETIGYEAFSSMSDLEYVTIGSGVKEIGEDAFRSDYKLKTIWCKVDFPFDLDENVFSESTYDNATLYVPVGSKINYMTSIGWSRFKNIVETDSEPTTAIEGITADRPQADVPVYSLSGQRLSQPQKGINIIGGKKVVVK